MALKYVVQRGKEEGGKNQWIQHHSKRAPKNTSETRGKKATLHNQEIRRSGKNGKEKEKQGFD